MVGYALVLIKTDGWTDGCMTGRAVTGVRAGLLLIGADVCESSSQKLSERQIKTWCEHPAPPALGWPRFQALVISLVDVFVSAIAGHATRDIKTCEKFNIIFSSRALTGPQSTQHRVNLILPQQPKSLESGPEYKDSIDERMHQLR